MTRIVIKNSIYWVLAVSLCASSELVSSASAQNEVSGDHRKPERYMVVLTMDERHVNSLRRDGRLKATLPPKFYNRVDSVLLKHPTTFLSKKLVIDDDDVDRVGRVLIVNVDESIVDRLEYQPVKMKIYQSGFNTIVLKYQRPRNREKVESIRRNAKPQPDDSPRVFVRLSPEHGTSGRIRGMKSLTVETAFGTADIRLDRIAGIRFNVNAPDDVVVISATGDYVTGKIKLEEIVLATRWGEEKIPVTELESISHSRDARFLESDSKVGRRWALQQPTQSEPLPVVPNRFFGNPPLGGLPNPSF